MIETAGSVKQTHTFYTKGVRCSAKWLRGSALASVSKLVPKTGVTCLL